MLIVNVGVLSDWQTAFADCLPGLRVCGWDDPGVDPGAVRYALVWAPTPGRLARWGRWAWLVEGAAQWLSGQTRHVHPAVARALLE